MMPQTASHDFAYWWVVHPISWGSAQRGGAQGRTRTGTTLRSGDFKSPAATNYATRAVKGRVGGGGRNRTGVHGFAGRCMTTLPPRPRKKTKGKAEPVTSGIRLPRRSGAGKESRTPDLNLGKVALYQLSYSRDS